VCVYVCVCVCVHMYTCVCACACMCVSVVSRGSVQQMEVAQDTVHWHVSVKMVMTPQFL